MINRFRIDRNLFKCYKYITDITACLAIVDKFLAIRPRLLQLQHATQFVLCRWILITESDLFIPQVFIDNATIGGRDSN